MDGLTQDRVLLQPLLLVKLSSRVLMPEISVVVYISIFTDSFPSSVIVVMNLGGDFFFLEYGRLLASQKALCCMNIQGVSRL